MPALAKNEVETQRGGSDLVAAQPAREMWRRVPRP